MLQQGRPPRVDRVGAFRAIFSLGSEENEKNRNERTPAVGQPTAGNFQLLLTIWILARLRAGYAMQEHRWWVKFTGEYHEKSGWSYGQGKRI